MRKIEKPRLVVRKSLRGMTIQIIKEDGAVIAGTWATKKDLESAIKKVVDQAIKKSVKQISFDRGKHPYHGNIKKVADAARSAGLEF